MVEVNYANIIKYLLWVLPEMRPYYHDRAPELYAAGNPHVVYGSILVEYVDSIERTREPSDEASRCLLEKIFNVIESLSLSPDFEVRCLIETGYLEGLLREKGDWIRFSPYMGPATKKLALEVAGE